MSLITNNSHLPNFMCLPAEYRWSLPSGTFGSAVENRSEQHCCERAVIFWWFKMWRRWVWLFGDNKLLQLYNKDGPCCCCPMACPWSTICKCSVACLLNSLWTTFSGTFVLFVDICGERRCREWPKFELLIFCLQFYSEWLQFMANRALFSLIQCWIAVEQGYPLY